LHRALALAVLCAAPAFAAPVTVDEALKEVEALYLQNDAGGALAAIEEARPLVRSKDDEAALAAWQSLLFYLAHRYDEAKLAMRAAIELSPTIAPPQRSPQAFARDFEFMRRAVRQQHEKHPETVGQSQAAAQLKKTSAPVKPARRAGAIVGLGGAAFTIAGVILVVHARRDYVRIESASADFPLELGAAREVATAGEVKQALGITFLSVGTAALVTAVILLAVGAEEAPPVTPQVSFSPDGAGIGLVGRF
jgi:hypothetical protein